MYYLNTTLMYYTLMYVHYCIVLVAHNGFLFGFIFLMAEVKRHKLDEIFGSIDMFS